MCIKKYEFKTISDISSVWLAAFSLDTEQPDYDLDSDDEAFVNKLKKKMEVGALQFEEMIDRLEKGSGQQVEWLLMDCEWFYDRPGCGNDFVGKFPLF